MSDMTATMNVNYEEYLSRSQEILNNVKGDIAVFPEDKLGWKANPKEWSAIEVLAHLNKMYNSYLKLLEDALQASENLENNQEQIRQSSDFGKQLINRVRPRGKERLFKTQTIKAFEPNPIDGNCSDIIHGFMQNKQQFHQLIKEAAKKNLNDRQITMPIGENLKLYIPEVFEFLLAHEDRHMIQIEEALEKSEVH